MSCACCSCAPRDSRCAVGRPRRPLAAVEQEELAQQSADDELVAMLGKLGDAIEHDLTPRQREVLLVLALNNVPIDVLAERLVPRRR